MGRQTVHTDQAPKAIGPYSQAVRAGNFVFCSGQLGLDPATGELRDGLEAQTEQALANLSSVLKAASSSLNAVVKTTLFLQRMEDFATVNGIYGKAFTAQPPARSTVAVAALPKGALIEIEAIAFLSE